MAAVIGSKLFFFKKPDYNKHKIHNNCLFPARTGDKTVKDLCAWGADILVGGDILATRKQVKIVVRALKVIQPFLVIGMRIDLFQPCGHSWVFQIC